MYVHSLIHITILDLEQKWVYLKFCRNTTTSTYMMIYEHSVLHIVATFNQLFKSSYNDSILCTVICLTGRVLNKRLVTKASFWQSPILADLTEFNY